MTKSKEITGKQFKNMRDLPSRHLLGTGTPMCAGCGGLEAFHEIYDILGARTVFTNAAGCMTMLSVYPFTAFRGSWLYTSMASAPAAAQGIRDALDILLQKGRIKQKDDLNVVTLTGDGSASGIGLSSASGAIDRNLDFIYICYDNEGYGNTGQQYSGGTPHGARTVTSKGNDGYFGYKKDLFSIWTSHKPSYAATVIGSEPLDLAKKIEKARNKKGARFIMAFAPCPTGWGYNPQESVKIGKLAVNTGVWPLKEYENGKVTHTKVPEKRKPVEEYLKLQNRFAHIFKPERNEELITEIQSIIDNYWTDVD